MATLTTSADPAPGGSRCRIVRCERVEVGDSAVLVRVTVALEGIRARHASYAQLLVVDGAQRGRREALPAPVADDARTLTLGFSIARSARALALELGGLSLPLPAAAVRSLDLPDRHQRALERAQQLAEQELRALQARLHDAQATSAAISHERDHAQRAAARAEAAAHDATARAEALESGLASAAHARRTKRRAAGAAVLIASWALVVALLAAPPRDSPADRGVTGVAIANTARELSDPLARRLQIPADYLELYQRAGARYGLDWTRLAAVGAIESRHGQARMAGVTSGANSKGASGPAQFLAGTWERFGVDGDGDGRRDPHAAADAITAMASYLRASGAPQDWHGALRSYNHSDVYANAVERLAAKYRRAMSAL